MKQITRRTSIIVLLAALVAVAGVACGSSNSPDRPSATTEASRPPQMSTATAIAAASPTSPSSTEAYPPCSGAQLTAVWATGNGYAGGYGEAYFITDISKASCSLGGRPVVVGIRSDGSQQQLYFPSASTGDSTVDLNPGDSAQLQFLFPDCSLVPPAQRTPSTGGAEFVSAALRAPGGGVVTLPPGRGAPQFQTLPPDTGPGYTCAGAGPGLYAKPWLPTPTPSG